MMPESVLIHVVVIVQYNINTAIEWEIIAEMCLFEKRNMTGQRIIHVNIIIKQSQ